MALVDEKHLIRRISPKEPENSTLSPKPVEEQPIQNPTQTLENEQLPRYHQAIAKWKNRCNHTDRVGVLCAHKQWDMADRRTKSLIYLNLAIEGRK